LFGLGSLVAQFTHQLHGTGFDGWGFRVQPPQPLHPGTGARLTGRAVIAHQSSHHLPPPRDHHLVASLDGVEQCRQLGLGLRQTNSSHDQNRQQNDQMTFWSPKI
jgi:hypothetical protein